ncbi:hypothetical protein ENU1_086590 [Entamoeba nuttalli P19]|uniref:FPL domain-containing protein n=2 Tax=Entamoeba nuttalli TaxID=412467 RepID=K2HWC8_ENTNP|nr:hypothetical protein ENU1_086590 [Entamoeba nuttalli P19]EKE40560.1 hypothetical protein ENU1_086590 [Entamoeba nuttalli P19]|eukprot:XP_008857111.1 hypothetical protein ENU1_086590 [Entamoeba nuttalli P19]
MFSRGEKKEDNSKRFNEKKMHSLAVILETPQKDLQVHLNAMRDVVEMLVWGDKHNTGIIDSFLEDNSFSTIIEIVKKGKKPALLQFLQCFAILVENIKSTNFLYFLLSQNTIETILSFPIDRNDEDLISPYISMLKSISLRLTDDTLQFFYNHQKNTCPILSEAVSLLNHKDSMIVSHSRNIILQFAAFTNDKAFNDYYMSYSQKHFYPHLASLILPHIHSLPQSLQLLIDDIYFISDLLTLPHPYPTMLTSSLFDNLIYPHILPSFISASATTPKKIDSLQFLIHLYESKFPIPFLSLISHCLLIPLLPQGQYNKLCDYIVKMVQQQNGMEFHCLITLLLQIIQTPPVSLLSRSFLSNPSQLSAPAALLSILEDENSDDDPLFGEESTKLNVMVDITMCFPWLSMKSDTKCFETSSRIMGDKQSFNSEGSVYEFLKNTSKMNRLKVINSLVEFCINDAQQCLPLWTYSRTMKIIKHIGWWGNGKLDDGLNELKQKVIESYNKSENVISKLYPRLKLDQFELLWNNITTSLEDISIEYEFGDDIDKWKNQQRIFIEKNFSKKQKALEIYYVIASCVIKRKLYLLFTKGEITKIDSIYWEIKNEQQPQESTKTSSNQQENQVEDIKDDDNMKTKEPNEVLK